MHAGRGPCDILEMVGTDRIMANSAGDWGKSDPLAVPELILEMRRRGHREEVIRKVVHDNPLTFWRQAHAGKNGPAPAAEGSRVRKQPAHVWQQRRQGNEGSDFSREKPLLRPHGHRR